MQHGGALISGIILMRERNVRTQKCAGEIKTEGTYVLSISTGSRKLQPLFLLKDEGIKDLVFFIFRKLLSWACF